MVLVLNGFNVTLTLPGIAGILLSIGMAVDANVIVFARIREELAANKSVRAAIDAGYNKALSAIIDGNVTTLIAAAVLGLFRKRQCPRLRADTGNRYYSFDVYGAVRNQVVHEHFLCTGPSGQEALRCRQEEKDDCVR